jgi:hypothetical protein
VKWEDEVVVITGGGGGLGRVLGEMFMRKGAKVAVLDVKGPDGSAEEEMERWDFVWEVCDVSDEGSVKKAVQTVVDEVSSHFSFPWLGEANWNAASHTLQTRLTHIILVRPSHNPNQQCSNPCLRLTTPYLAHLVNNESYACNRDEDPPRKHHLSLHDPERLSSTSPHRGKWRPYNNYLLDPITSPPSPSSRLLRLQSRRLIPPLYPQPRTLVQPPPRCVEDKNPPSRARNARNTPLHKHNETPLVRQLFRTSVRSERCSEGDRPTSGEGRWWCDQDAVLREVCSLPGRDANGVAENCEMGKWDRWERRWEGGEGPIVREAKDALVYGDRQKRDCTVQGEKVWEC